MIALLHKLSDNQVCIVTRVGLATEPVWRNSLLLKVSGNYTGNFISRLRETLNMGATSATS